MFSSILILLCILIRGQLCLNTKETLIELNSNTSPNGINGSISTCGVEELSKLLTDKIAMNRAIDLATHRQSKSKEEFINNILNFALNSDSNEEEEALRQEDNEIHRIADTINSPPIPQTVRPNAANRYEDSYPIPSILHLLPGQIKPFKDIKDFDTFRPFPPHRNIRLPPGAKVKIDFKDKKREVMITVSPLMTVIEALKQAEIKFKRSFKLSLDNDLISFWLSPTLGCVVVDRVSRVENESTMMWMIKVFTSDGETEWNDLCLPANGELFVMPGMTVQLVYTSVRNLKDI